MKIDNIDNIANKEKSPDKAERSASIDEIKKTQKLFDFNDLSSNAATINNNKNLIIPEKDALFDYLSPGSSKLKKLLLNSDPEVANLNINNNSDKLVHNNSEYLNNNNINNVSNNSNVGNNHSGSTYNVLPLDSTTSNVNNTINNNNSSILSGGNTSSSNSSIAKNHTNSLLKPKLSSLENVALNSVKSSNSSSNNNIVASNSCESKRSARNLNKPKLFWCSECNEYFLKLNLFNHMKSVHNKFTCLYCFGFFVKIESLEKHLVKKHKVQNTSFSDEQTLRHYFDVKEDAPDAVAKVIKAVCCKCGSIFIITDNNFHSHSCDGGNEKFLAIKEAVQSCSDSNNHIQHSFNINNNNNSNNSKVPISDFSNNVTSNLAVQENSNCIEALTTSSVNQLNSAKDDLYCEKAIQQWLQPNIKPIFNGASNNLNEASSQSVPPPNILESDEKAWHVEEQKLTNENKLTVPKLTLKLPKGFQNQKFDNIDSDEDSGDEEEDDESGVEDENASCDFDKNKSAEQNFSNSINEEYSSSLSDSDNEDSSSRKQNETGGDSEVVPVQEKRPENLPCLKLKIKNLTSNPQSVLENYTANQLPSAELLSSSSSLSSTIGVAEINNDNKDDVDLSECPMDIEPSILQDEKEPEPKRIIIDGNLIVPANEDVLPIDIRLDESLDRIPILKLMKICLRASFQFCLYCNHARKIVVNGKGLALHFITHHRFHALVDSITAEELHPEKFVDKFQVSMDELLTCYFNLDTYDDHDEEKKEGHVTISHDKLYECFQCRFQTPIHKELYLHNRKMHQKSLINCLMCKMGFYSYSELLCHICPGVANKQTFNDYKFYCCLCNMDNIPSAFRLMVHLRKKHYACDVCLEKCSDQSKLSSHVWKHKLLHICYRCHIFYQNKADIMKHLFWKHGTEGIECKKCLQKKWPHVYHFCIPPATFTCSHCEMQFSRAMSLKVHLRLHEDGAKYACTEIGCEKKFISKKLLIRHLERHQSELAAQEKGDAERTEATVIIPHEIPEGCCTRTIPVVFKRFIKKPAIRRIEAIETNTDQTKVSNESEQQSSATVAPITKKEEDNIKDPKSLPDLPDTKLNLSESSDDDSSSSDDENNSKKSKTAITVPEKLKRLDEDKLQQQNNVINSNPNNPINNNKNYDDDDEKSGKNIESLEQLNKVSTLSDSEDDDPNNDSKMEVVKEEKSELNEPMKNIMENLKNFQESQSTEVKTEATVVADTKYADIKEKKCDEKKKQDEDEIPDKLPEKVKLHVCMSDHDYAKLYKPAAGTTTEDLEDSIMSATIDKDVNKNNKKSHENNNNNRKEEKSSSKASKKNAAEKSALGTKKKSDDFSSSDSSSGDSSSDSSNSSSSGSSSSSDSSTSDSSSSEASSTNITNRPRTKKYTKKRSKKENKKNETEPEEVPRDPDDIIYESDLLTDQTDTDEDFYDEHPLKMNNQALSEKRKQLGDIDGIIENSRPSTPSLPPDEKIEKRLKVKRRKRDHKKSVSSPSKQQRDSRTEQNNSIVNADDESTCFSQANYPQYSNNNNNKKSLVGSIKNPPETPQNFKNSKFSQGFMHTSTPISAPPRIELHQANQIRQLLQSTQQQPVLPILKEQQQHGYFAMGNNSVNNSKYDEYISVSRVSSAQSSRMNSDNEQSGVKRSQRRRIPNKFYGYTSDDDTMASQLSMAQQNDPFKPIPPPNLTWNKEDLPSRSKSPNSQQQQLQQQINTAPRVAPLKLNLHSNSDQQQQQQPPQIYDNYDASMSHQQAQQLPVNNLFNNSNNNSTIQNDNSTYNYSDSDESSNDQLHISEPKKRKRKLPSQNMYAFHTLETPPTVQTPNQPPIPRLKLTIGSNNKIRRRNINPLKPPPKKRRKTAAGKAGNVASLNDLSMTSSNTLTTSLRHQHDTSVDNNYSMSSQSNNNDTKSSNKQTQQDKKQKLEEAIMNTQQYFQRYNHTQVSNVTQDQTDNNDDRVYCYCRRPYDDLQGMIGCDGANCQIEWFHFECVGILVPPKGNWFCPECQKEQHQQTF